MKNVLKNWLVAGATLTLASSSFAAGTDFSLIAAGADFSSAAAAVVGGAAAIAVVYVAIAGSKGVLRMFKSA